MYVKMKESSTRYLSKLATKNIFRKCFYNIATSSSVRIRRKWCLGDEHKVIKPTTP